MEYSQTSQTTDRIVGIGNRLISAIELQANYQKEHQKAVEESSKSQNKHQKSIVALTVVIALSTVIYTGVTVWSTLLLHNQVTTAEPTLSKN